MTQWHTGDCLLVFYLTTSHGSKVTRSKRQSAVPGVSWNKKKWQVCLNLGGKRRYLRNFEEEADAANAVEDARAAEVAGSLEKHLKGRGVRKRRRSKRQSTVQGVSWHKQTQKWQARLTLGGKTKYFGHAEEAEALKAHSILVGRSRAGGGQVGGGGGGGRRSVGGILAPQAQFWGDFTLCRGIWGPGRAKSGRSSGGGGGVEKS